MGMLAAALSCLVAAGLVGREDICAEELGDAELLLAIQYEKARVKAVAREVRVLNSQGPVWQRSDAVVLTSYMEWSVLGASAVAQAANGRPSPFKGKLPGRDYALEPDAEHGAAVAAWKGGGLPALFFPAQVSADQKASYAAEKITDWLATVKPSRGEGRVILEDHVSLLVPMFYSNDLVDAVRKLLSKGHRLGILTCNGAEIVHDFDVLPKAAREFWQSGLKSGAITVFRSTGMIKVLPRTAASSRRWPKLAPDLALQQAVGAFLGTGRSAAGGVHRFVDWSRVAIYSGEL